ncbi:phage head closure protein [Paludisphaera sp.]|uniref:phage head closure protein n=1 Tax=Paludisphaera sp. TaxID=2017432 RepID=UPI00301E11C0
MIDPGQMRTRLVYEEPTPTGLYDEHGDPVEPWTARFEFWARVRPVKGSESIQAGQAAGSRSHEIVCRWRPGFTIDGRLRFKLEPDRAMQIESIVDWEERRAELTITATEEA